MAVLSIGVAAMHARGDLPVGVELGGDHVLDVVLQRSVLA
jgi:hypothetical protein